MDFLTSTTHLHITAWVIAIVLFLVLAVAAKPNKGLHMALRLMYIVVFVSGILLFTAHRDTIKAINDGSGMVYDMKVLFGVLVIGFMEMILVRKKKDKPTTIFWVLFGITLAVTAYLGLFNGIGFDLSGK